jgi:hypothetical protein
MHVFDKSSVCKVGQLRRYERRIVKAIREENTRGETRGETMRSILTSSSSTHKHTSSKAGHTSSTVGQRRMPLLKIE